MSDIEILGTLAPNAGSTAPLTRAEYVLGSTLVVANAAARDAIPATVLRTKQLCLLADTGLWYQWSGASWGAYTGFSGGGGIAGIPMTFFASTVDGDPTAGGLRLNHATPASATQLYVDDVEASDGTNIRDLIAALGNVIGAQVRLQSKSADENWIVYRVGGYTSASGYGKLTGLTVIDSSATVTLSTTAGDTILSIDVGLPKDLGNQGLTSARYIAFNGIFAITPTTGSVTIDAANGQRQRISMTGNVSVTLTTPPGPMSVEVAWVQDATGGRTVSFVTSVGGDLPPISLVGSATTVTVLDWNGTAWAWAYSFVRNPDVAVGAAIDGAKISPAFGGQLVTSSTGFLSIGTAYYGVGEPPSSGTGAHRSMAATGDIRLPRGSSSIVARNDADGGDVNLLYYQSNVGGVPVIDFGDSVGPVTAIVRLKGGNAGELRAGTNPTVQWGIGTFNIQASSVFRLRTDTTGLGLYTATPVAQQTRPGQLTDSSTGSATGTIADVGASFSQAGLNNIHASLIAKINAIEAKLSQAAGGLGAWT